MEYKDFIKIGAKVRYEWRDYDYYSATAKGYGEIPYETHEEIVTICGKVRDADTKKFVSLNGYVFDEDFEVEIENEKGSKFYVTLSSLSPYKELSELSREELMKLRTEISVGSAYYSDYENSFGVDKEIVCGFSDGYLEEMQERYGTNWHEFDSPEEFADYILG